MAAQAINMTQIKKRWKPFIDDERYGPVIKEAWKKKVTAILLENTANEMESVSPDMRVGPGASGFDGQFLAENAPNNQSGAFPNATNLKGFDPILISLVRRSMPNLIAYDVCGV